jgi:hypothetical protein
LVNPVKAAIGKPEFEPQIMLRTVAAMEGAQTITAGDLIGRTYSA